MHNCTKHYIDTHSPLITCTQHIILKRPVLSLHAHNTLYWYTQSTHYMHITHYIYTPSPLITCTQHIILIHTILSLHTHNTLYWYTQYPHYKHTTLYTDIYLHITHNTDTHNTFITCTHSPLIAPTYCTILIHSSLTHCMYILHYINTHSFSKWTCVPMLLSSFFPEVIFSFFLLTPSPYLQNYVPTNL